MIDILLIIIVLLGIWHGWQRGFLFAAFDLIRWVVGLIAALRFYQPVGKVISRFSPWSDVWDRPVAFILISLVTSIVIYAIGYALFKRVPEEYHKRRLNKIFGTLPGAFSGAIAAAIVAALLLSMPLNEGLSERARNSQLANRLAGYTADLEAQLRPVFEEAITQTLNLLTIKPESSERVELPFTVSSSPSRPDLEARMLDLVNNERRAAGLNPLAMDQELTEVARKHSDDMFKRGYFAHISPENESADDRIRAANIRFLTAGENLALAPSLQIAHTGLMNSPGHRANILRPQFGRVGIGIKDGGIRGLMVTQNFRN
jgi:uncharacterized protein YkwD